MQEEFTNLRSLVGAFAKAMNLINRDMEHHHEQTAYLAYMVAQRMGLQGEDLHHVIFAALLHDIGSIVSPDPEDLCEIESHRREVAKIGANMIRDLEHFRSIACILEVVQNSYQENLALFGETAVLDVCQAVHISDAAVTMLDPDKPVLSQVREILDVIRQYQGTEFSQKAVDALTALSRIEYVWMDVAMNPEFLMFFTGRIHSVSLDDALAYTLFMSRIIDYRSPFTAMHSAGVAASARELARLYGMSEEDCKKMEIAGRLHDVGKLRVPNSILEKPGKLTDDEFDIVKEHPYYTRKKLWQSWRTM